MVILFIYGGIMSNIFHKKGQLSLELMLLIFAVVLGGAVVSFEMVKNPSFKNTQVEGIKEISFSGFIKNENVSSPTTTNDNNTGDTNNNSETSDSNNNTNVLPDLVPNSIVVKYSNGTEIGHGYRENVQNNGNNQQSTNQFRHKGGHLNNNANIIIRVDIENIGAGNVSKNFKVALYDNGKWVDEVTAQKDGDNQWYATFEYELKTSRGGNQQQYQNNGNNNKNQQQNKYQGKDRTIENHTLKAVVDYYNVVNESNESNNDISVDIGVNISVQGNNNANGAGNLYIELSGDTEGVLTKDMIDADDAEFVSGDISLKTNGYSDYEYNANGTVYGDIYVTGSAKYKLGNLQKIESLQAYLDGSSELDIDVPEIDTFTIRKKGGASEIGGGVHLNIYNSDIGTFYVNKITGGANLKFENFSIGTFETDSGDFGGGAETIFESGRITSMNLGNIVGGGKPKFKNVVIGDIVINNMDGGPEINFENTAINSIKINKLTGNPKILLEHSSSLNYLEANELSGSDIEVKDGSSLKEINILGSTGYNGKIYVEDGCKLEKLTVNGNVNADITIEGVLGLISVDVGDITSGGKLYIDEALGSSVKTGIVCNWNGVEIEDSTLSTVNIKGVSNSGHATIKNSNIDSLDIGSLPDWGSTIDIENCNVSTLKYTELKNGKISIKNSNIKTLSGNNLDELINSGHIVISNSWVNGKYYN